METLLGSHFALLLEAWGCNTLMLVQEQAASLLSSSNAFHSTGEWACAGYKLAPRLTERMSKLPFQRWLRWRKRWSPSTWAIRARRSQVCRLKTTCLTSTANQNWFCLGILPSASDSAHLVHLAGYAVQLRPLAGKHHFVSHAIAIGEKLAGSWKPFWCFTIVFRGVVYVCRWCCWAFGWLIYLFSSESAAFQRVGGAYVETPLQNWLVWTIAKRRICMVPFLLAPGHYINHQPIAEEGAGIVIRCAKHLWLVSWQLSASKPWFCTGDFPPFFAAISKRCTQIVPTKSRPLIQDHTNPTKATSVARCWAAL